MFFFVPRLEYCPTYFVSGAKILYNEIIINSFSFYVFIWRANDFYCGICFDVLLCAVVFY